MSNIPADLKYARTHEWLRDLGNGEVEMGISDHAQHALGDLVYVEVPEVGRTLAAGDACAVVESVKAASDVYSPVAGTITAVNAQLAKSPEAVNQDPYGGGWIMRIKLAGSLADSGLLTAADYQAIAADE